MDPSFHIHIRWIQYPPLCLKALEIWTTSHRLIYPSFLMQFLLFPFKILMPQHHLWRNHDSNIPTYRDHWSPPLLQVNITLALGGHCLRGYEKRLLIEGKTDTVSSSELIFSYTQSIIHDRKVKVQSSAKFNSRINTFSVNSSKHILHNWGPCWFMWEEP